MTQVSQERDMQTFGPEVNDCHFVFGQTFLRFKNVNCLERDPSEDRAFWRQLERANRLERRNDLARVAIVTVTEVHKVQVLVERFLSPAAG